jgi:hypothetical protein
MAPLPEWVMEPDGFSKPDFNRGCVIQKSWIYRTID